MAVAAHVQTAPALDTRSLRAALGKFATGVAFITAAVDGEPAGLIVNSLASVSLEPPLVSFCPSRSSLTWSRMRRNGRFAVNVLGRRHERFARRVTPAGADRFAGIHWEPGRGGVPVLTDALATLECDIVAEHPAGDHWIVIGRVERLRTSTGTDPLVFFNGAFIALQRPHSRHDTADDHTQARKEQLLMNATDAATPRPALVLFLLVLAVMIGALAVTLASAGAARAAFPGINGKIACASRDAVSSNIWVMNADGSGRNYLAASTDSENDPAFSRDGSKIPYTRGLVGNLTEMSS